jgi:hypothetical protein
MIADGDEHSAAILVALAVEKGGTQVLPTDWSLPPFAIEADVTSGHQSMTSIPVYSDTIHSTVDYDNADVVPLTPYSSFDDDEADVTSGQSMSSISLWSSDPLTPFSSVDADPLTPYSSVDDDTSISNRNHSDVWSSFEDDRSAVQTNNFKSIMLRSVENVMLFMARTGRHHDLMRVYDALAIENITLVLCRVHGVRQLRWLHRRRPLGAHVSPAATHELLVRLGIDLPDDANVCSASDDFGTSNHT